MGQCSNSTEFDVFKSGVAEADKGAVNLAGHIIIRHSKNLKKQFFDWKQPFVICSRLGIRVPMKIV